MQSDSASLQQKDGDLVKVALHADYFKSHLCDIPSLEMEVSKSQLVDMYRQMVSMRRMEMAADQVSSRRPRSRFKSAKGLGDGTTRRSPSCIRFAVCSARA